MHSPCFLFCFTLGWLKLLIYPAWRDIRNTARETYKKKEDEKNIPYISWSVQHVIINQPQHVRYMIRNHSVKLIFQRYPLNTRYLWNHSTALTMDTTQLSGERNIHLCVDEHLLLLWSMFSNYRCCVWEMVVICEFVRTNLCVTYVL